MRLVWCAAVVFLLASGLGQAGLLHPTPTTATEADEVRAWLASLQFTTAGNPGFGAVRVSDTVGHQGGGKDWYQVNPYFANQGMLGYVRSTAPDHLTRTWNHIQWTLDNRNATD
ncbi:MAG: hypothetical protein LC623_08470 [Halobacteriales archaeon]|nr:hypothetical protein [Halobacteriales archaeon]